MEILCFNVIINGNIHGEIRWIYRLKQNGPSPMETGPNPAKAPSSELEDHRFCTDCWEERSLPEGKGHNPPEWVGWRGNDELYNVDGSQDCFVLTKACWRCGEMSMESFRWILVLLLVEWNVFFYFSSCKSCSMYTIAISLTILFKNFASRQEPTSQFRGFERFQPHHLRFDWGLFATCPE